MQCDFTPEALIALRDKGFQIVSNPNEADYRLGVEVLACDSFTHTEDKGLVSVWMYDQRKEIPLEKKPHLQISEWSWGGKLCIGKNNIDRVIKHLNDVFDKL